MASNDPFIRGEDVVLKFYQQKGAAMKNVLILAKNWNVDENATEIAEGVQGENRDRLDKVTNYYEGSFDIYQNDKEFIEAYIEAQEALDSNQIPLKQSFAVLTKTPKGNFAYVCQEAVVGPCKESMTSRQDAVMYNVKFRFRYYRRVPSI